MEAAACQQVAEEEVANVVYFAFCVNISPTLSPTCPIWSRQGGLDPSPLNLPGGKFESITRCSSSSRLSVSCNNCRNSYQYNQHVLVDPTNCCCYILDHSNSLFFTFHRLPIWGRQWCQQLPHQRHARGKPAWTAASWTLSQHLGIYTRSPPSLVKIRSCHCHISKRWVGLTVMVWWYVARISPRQRILLEQASRVTGTQSSLQLPGPQIQAYREGERESLTCKTF